MAMLGYGALILKRSSSRCLIYFLVCLPARQNEIEYIKAGVDVGYDNGPDQFHMAIAKERTGVDPAWVVQAVGL